MLGARQESEDGGSQPEETGSASNCKPQTCGFGLPPTTPSGKTPAGAVDALVGVGSEEITLGLDQVGPQSLGAIGVVEGQGARISGDRNAAQRPRSRQFSSIHP